MADRLRVTELDFDAIKNNLKAFLKQQNEFTDYDFEGSGLSVLLDILAYNTHYNAYYLNMVANESFLDTALLRNSVVSHAKSLGYIPYSSKASVAKINLEVISNNSNLATLTLTEGRTFLSNQIDGRTYNFVVLDDITVTKANSSYLFENVSLYEGQIVNYRFVYDEQSNPKQIFTLPENNIDISTIKVLVYNESTSSEYSVYQKVRDVVDVDGSSEVYFLQESRTGKYEIYFGNDFVGKKLPAGAVIVVSYLVTNGTAANKANNFISTFTLQDDIGENLTNFIITPVSEAAGGSDKESVDSIKNSAINNYVRQNRLVTVKDYESYILQNYPNLDSISVWSGDEEVPPVFGKVFISLKPKNNFFISESEKERIIEDIIKPVSMVSTDAIIKNPDFLYLKLINEVTYNSDKTLLSQENLKNLIRTVILNFFDLNINKFNATFALSKLYEEIDNSDSSIVGIKSQLKLEKRFQPTLNTKKTYTINFNTSLFKGTTLNRIQSTEFDVFDSGANRRTCQIEEIMDSFSGITNIVITDPGTGYITNPEVTIVGDGEGATAIAKVVNGKVESITITNRGINYTKASVQIKSDSGFNAEATPVLDSRFGVLRLVYFDENFERKIVNSNVGTINYDTGEIILNDLNILSVSSNDGLIRILAQSEKDVISTIKNTILTIDLNDTSSIFTSLVRI